MLEWLLPLGALAAGLASTPHCALMCGPLLSAHMRGAGSGAATTATAAGDCATGCTAQRRRGLLYSSGRIAAYTLLGALAGAFGRGLHELSARVPLHMLAGIILGAGLGMAGWLVWRQAQDKPAAVNLPGRLARSLRCFVPGNSPVASLATGALSALLPCAALLPLWLLAAGSGSAVAGAQLSLAFGLGTLPGALGWLWLSTQRLISLRVPLWLSTGLAVIVIGLRLWLVPVEPGDSSAPLCTTPGISSAENQSVVPLTIARAVD